MHVWVSQPSVGFTGYAFATHIISEKGVDIINERGGGARRGEGVELSIRAFVFFSIDQGAIDCLVDTPSLIIEG